MARRRKKKQLYKKLTSDQEFHLMALILDKFLWLGIALIGFGIFRMISRSVPTDGVPYILSGLGVMIVFGAVIVRYFEGHTK
jgi:hypothetical protein